MFFYILMIIGLILMVFVIISFNRLNDTLKKQIKKEEIKPKRTHSQVSKTNFSNILNGRINVYDKYKNKDGLYEPIKGKAGINLNGRANRGEEGK